MSERKFVLFVVNQEAFSFPRFLEGELSIDGVSIPASMLEIHIAPNEEYLLFKVDLRRVEIRSEVTTKLSEPSEPLDNPTDV